jgi:hypothetical protein
MLQRVRACLQTIQSMSSCQSSHVYHTSEYEWVQTFMKYDQGTARFLVTAPFGVPRAAWVWVWVWVGVWV